MIAWLEATAFLWPVDAAMAAAGSIHWAPVMLPLRRRQLLQLYPQKGVSDTSVADAEVEGDVHAQISVVACVNVVNAQTALGSERRS